MSATSSFQEMQLCYLNIYSLLALKIVMDRGNYCHAARAARVIHFKNNDCGQTKKGRCTIPSTRC